MKKFYLSFFLLVFLLVSESYAQGNARKHFIYFKDKANTPFSVSQPQAYLSAKAIARRTRQNIPVKFRDLPVKPAYITALQNTGATVLYKSKWLNGALVLCDSSVLTTIQSLSFVKKAETTNRVQKPGKKAGKIETETAISLRIAANRSDYGISYNQAEMIGATAMHDAGFHGENMTIAVFDAGFPGVDTAIPFNHLFLNNQIVGTYDFVDKDASVYEKNSHGTNTLSTIGAYQLGKFIGTAYKANFYLFITEDAGTEYPVEEYNWLFAAEYADSAGVDLINSSLGYTQFDNPIFDHTYADMNGRTAVASRAAAIAASTGMLVVNSAGNEGQSAWHYIGAPADADSILTVGAVDSMGFKAAFSSFGPTSDGRIKPNVSAQGVLAAVVLPGGQISRNNGTSFSSPIMCGLAAGFWGANPSLTNLQVIQFLQQSGNQHSNPDNNLGYGIPNFTEAQLIAAAALGIKEEVAVIPNPIVNNNTVSLQLKTPYNGPVSVKIYDRTGRLMQENDFRNENRDKVFFKLRPSIGAGLYFMQISWADQVKTSRLVKLQ